MHRLIDLPFDYNALVPHMDAETVEIHHSKHHQGYVNKLNAALEKHPELFELSLEELLKDLNQIPEDIKTSVINNGGGTYNHNLFWNSISQNGGKFTENELTTEIKNTFETYDKFKENFSNAAISQFASGWAWLTLKDSKLNIISSSGHNTPLSNGEIPLLVIDVWEHAYYLKYQNRRAEFVSAWWELIDWEKANKRFVENR